MSISSPPALAGATELFREQSTVTVERNTITAESNARYGGYVAGETIPITLEYMATCNVVFGGLTLVRRAPFGPSAGVSGDIGNITAVPAKGYPASMGSVTFDLKFNSLGRDAGDGDVSGLVRLNLVLGVDKDDVQPRLRRSDCPCPRAVSGYSAQPPVTLQVKMFDEVRGDFSLTAQ